MRKLEQDRFDLISQKKRLAAERDKRISDIRFRCAAAIEVINEELRLSTPRKVTAIERYTELSDAPQRYCEGCKEPLLRATVENARLMVASSKKLQEIHDGREIRYTDLRKMQKKFCCHCCEQEPGKGSHSVWCYSVLSQSREDELDEEYS